MSNEKLKPAPGAGEIPQPEYLNKAQIAARLGVSRRTVDNLVAARKLPHVKFSARLVRFPRAAVDDYLARNLTVAARGQEGGDSHV